MTAIARAVRLVYLQRLLRDRSYRAVELADLCGVSANMIYRDLGDLGVPPLSVPVVSERGRWRVVDWGKEADEK